MRNAILGSLLVAAITSTTARAQAPADPRPDPDYSAVDWVASFFIGNAAGTAGALAGGGLGYALAGDCDETRDDDSFFGPCAFHGVGEMVIGGTLGATFGGAAGIYAYGELSGHDGSYWAAAAGFAGGLLVTGGFGVLVSDLEAGPAMTWAALFTLPALGGTLGYVLSLENGGGTDVPRHGALIEVDEGALRLGVPDVGVRLDAEARLERVDVRLMAGSF